VIVNVASLAGIEG